MKKSMSFILISCLFISMQPLMAQEAAVAAVEEVTDAQQQVKPTAVLSWWRSLRRPTRQDWQNLKSYVNSKYRCLRYGEGCSRKERAKLVALAAFVGVVVGTATAWKVKKVREKRAEREESLRVARETMQAMQKVRERQAQEMLLEKRWFGYAKKGNLEEIRKMMKQQFVVNTPDNLKRNTALMWAVIGRHIEVVRELLKDRKIKINQRNLKGYTALMWAAIGGYPEIVKELLKAGADWTIKRDADWLPDIPHNVGADILHLFVGADTREGTAYGLAANDEIKELIARFERWQTQRIFEAGRLKTQPGEGSPFSKLSAEEVWEIMPYIYGEKPRVEERGDPEVFGTIAQEDGKEEESSD